MEISRSLIAVFSELCHQLDMIEDEKNRLKTKRDSIGNFIYKCATFDESILFVISDLLSFVEQEQYSLFVYTKHSKICHYPETYSEGTYIGIASEKNILEVTSGNQRLDDFFSLNLGYEICWKKSKMLPLYSAFRDEIVRRYNIDSFEKEKKPITFSFLLDKCGVENLHCASISQTNFDDYPYVQDFIIYLFNLQTKGERLTYEKMVNALNDFLILEKNNFKNRSKKG